MRELLLSALLAAAQPQFTETYPIKAAAWEVRCISPLAIQEFEAYLYKRKSEIDNAGAEIEKQIGFRPAPVELRILITPLQIQKFNEDAGAERCAIYRRHRHSAIV